MAAIVAMIAAGTARRPRRRLMWPPGPGSVTVVDVECSVEIVTALGLTQAAARRRRSTPIL